MKHRPAFTLIEMLVTIAVIALIASMAVPSYAAMQRRSVINAVSQEIVDTLQVARTRSISAHGGSDHEIRVFTDHYDLVMLTDGSTTTHALPNSFTLAPNGAVITFERLSGLCTSCAPTIPLGLEYNGTQEKTITITSSGTISLD